MKSKKLLSVLLALILLCTCLPVAFADPISEQKCGDNVYWSFDEATGTLTLTGTGSAYDYDYHEPEEVPWYTLRRSIKSIEVGEGITGLGTALFYECTEKSVSLPSTLTDLGEFTFAYNIFLEDVNIPEGITEIPEACFSVCISLSEITLPDSLEVIGRVAFRGANMVEITLPNGLKTIQEDAFTVLPMQEITIPASVEEIEINAFRYSTITHINNYSDTAVSFETHGAMFNGFSEPNISHREAEIYICFERYYGYILCAYQNPYGLFEQVNSLYPPENHTEEEYDRYVYATREAAMCYVNEKFGTDYSTPNEIIDLVDKSSEQSVEPWFSISCNKNSAEHTYCRENGIPHSLNDGEICGCECGNHTDANGDYRCDNCNTVLLSAENKCGDNVYWRFDETTGTLILAGTGATYDYNNVANEGTKVPWYEIRREIKSIEVKEGITYLGEYLFHECTEKTVSIPTTVTAFGRSVFEYNVFLTAVDLPDNIIEIPDNCFCGCVSLEHLSLPQTVTVIGRQALCCTALSEINLPQGLRKIGHYAFAENTLSEITIPSTVEEIGNQAFLLTVLTRLINQSDVAVGAQGNLEESNGCYCRPFGTKENMTVYLEYVRYATLLNLGKNNPYGLYDDIYAMYLQDKINNNGDYTYIEAIITAAICHINEKYGISIESEDELEQLVTVETEPPFCMVYCNANSAEHLNCIENGVPHELLDCNGYDCICSKHIDADKNGECDACFAEVEVPDTPGNGFIEKLREFFQDIADWFTGIFDKLANLFG